MYITAADGLKCYVCTGRIQCTEDLVATREKVDCTGGFCTKTSDDGGMFFPHLI